MSITDALSGPLVVPGGQSSSRHPRASTLPDSLPPRGLSRKQAAEYIGVSPTHFDTLIRTGIMPPPKRMIGRVVWDRHQLDRAFNALDAESSGHDSDADTTNSVDQLLQHAREAQIHKRGS